MPEGSPRFKTMPSRRSNASLNSSKHADGCLVKRRLLNDLPAVKFQASSMNRIIAWPMFWDWREDKFPNEAHW